MCLVGEISALYWLHYSRIILKNEGAGNVFLSTGTDAPWNVEFRSWRDWMRSIVSYTGLRNQCRLDIRHRIMLIMVSKVQLRISPINKLVNAYTSQYLVVYLHWKQFRVFLMIPFSRNKYSCNILIYSSIYLYDGAWRQHYFNCTTWSVL